MFQSGESIQEVAEQISSTSATDNLTLIQNYSEKAIEGVIDFAPKILLAIAIMVIGLWIVKKIVAVFANILGRSNLGPELTGFFMSMASLALKFVVILIAAGTLGFQVSALMGVLAGVVFAIGLALQGFLGNFASGITIVFFKPYKVGDWVQISDMFGKVESIQIFNTILATPSDKTLIIPNGQVTDNIITNFSTKGRMRLELNVTMPYAESFPKVKEVINKSLENFPLIMDDPAPLIGIESFDSHNIIVSVRPYIHPDNYWDAKFEALGRIKKGFKDAGIEVAYSEGIELGKIGD